MKAIVIGLTSAGLLFALAGGAGAATHRHRYSHNYNSPSAIAERQRHASTFDPTQYYEHDLTKIPLGTQTWWDQYDREHGGDRR
jgi:hypothetical protein